MGETRRAPVKVIALTAGRHTPSRRFRVEQLVPDLAARGVEVVERVAPIARTAPVPVVPRLRPAKVAFGAMKLAAQVPAVVSTHRGDLTWLQKELLPGYRSLERLCAGPLVLDLDDAVWLTRPGAERHVRRLLGDVDLVTAGNDHLASWCEAAGTRAVVVPTAIDVHRWSPAPPRSPDGSFVLGWIGQRSNLPALEALDDVLADVLALDRSSRLVVCADGPPRLRSVRPDQVQFVPWSPATEVDAVRGMDVGLMPLSAVGWSEGKCSMKLLQYQACGVAAVASPTGANRAAAADGAAAALAATLDEWRDVLLALRADAGARARQGSAGRRWVVERYSTAVAADRLAAAFGSVAA